MPKRRQFCNWESAASASGGGGWPGWVMRNAPFGTSFTPNTASLRIIDGKMVSVQNEVSNDVTKKTLLTSRDRGHRPPNYSSSFSSSSSVIDRNSTGEEEQTIGARVYESSAIVPLPPVTSKQSVNQSDPMAADSRWINGSNEGLGVDFNRQPDLQSPEPAYSVRLRRILPPINTGNGRSRDQVISAEISDPESNNRRMMIPEENPISPWIESDRRITTDDDDDQPLRRTEEDLEILAGKIRTELTDFSGNQLKYVYLRLAEIDTGSTGFVSFTDLEETFRQSKIGLNPITLEAVAFVFRSDSRSNRIDYNALLSFVAKSLRTMTSSRPEDNQVLGTSGLRRLVERQLLGGGCSLQFEQIWNLFQQADRGRRDRFSREQIKRLIASCRLPLSEPVIDQILDRCSVVSGRHSWQEFLSYIEHVYPVKTSLNIPPTTRRIREARQVNNDWLEEETTPRVRISEIPLEEELSKLGATVREARRRLNETKTNTMRLNGRRPWFERFMEMAKTIYDLSKSGLLNVFIVKWIVHEYNLALDLGLVPDRVQSMMRLYIEADKVIVEPFLKALLDNGPSH